MNDIQALYACLKRYHPLKMITLDGPLGESEIHHIDIGSTQNPPYIAITWGKDRHFAITVYYQGGNAYRINQLFETASEVYQSIKGLIHENPITKTIPTTYPQVSPTQYHFHPKTEWYR